MPKPSSYYRQMVQVAESFGVNPKDITERTAALLKHSRHIAWLTEDIAADWQDRLHAFAPHQTDDALIWLDHFAPAETRCRAYQDKDQIRRNRFIYQTLRRAVEMTAGYPFHGPTYFTILDQCYFVEHPHKDADIAAHLHIERSTFYARKREAILCCALQITRLYQEALAAENIPL